MFKIDESIKNLKREIFLNLIPIGIITLLIIGFFIFGWIIQNRENFMILVYVGTALSTILLLAISFLLFHNILPRKRYIKLLKEAQFTNIYKNEIVFLEELKEETFKGVPCLRLLVKEKDEEKEIEFLIERSSFSFNKNKTYVIFSHDMLILWWEEK